ncbi:hypothetical protein [Micromonospora sp. SL4-19]|uniref:hypothetical protein n=1 Tax=Micromonospora sp. SL4-19 TaxID=3399129 RepID=UPI003A4E3CE4
MLGTARKVRTTMTMWRRSLWRYRLTTAGVSLTLFGAATALRDLPRPISVAAAVAGCLVSAMDVRANRRRARMVRFQSRDSDTYRDVTSQSADLGPIVESAHDIGVLMARENTRLRKGPIRAEVDGSDYLLPRELKSWSFDFLARRARTAAMHNGPVLGLATDLPTEEDEATVMLRRARYFDFYGSNLLAPFDVWEAGRRMPTLRGRDLILDRHGRLRTFKRSRLANTVGVSTLAFTTDGQLLLVAQTKDNVGSPGLIAPSGSGALEPRDVPRDHSRLTVEEIIVNGAVRELQEECNLKPGEVGESRVVGHGRWISRGAMPEFCAVTLLKLTSDQALDRAIRRVERPYVDEVMAVNLAPLAQWDPGRPLDILPDDARHAASWPLAFGLACLAECMNDESWPLRKEIGALLDQ